MGTLITMTDLIRIFYVLSGNVDLRAYFLGACTGYIFIQFVNLFLCKSGDLPSSDTPTRIFPPFELLKAHISAANASMLSNRSLNWVCESSPFSISSKSSEVSIDYEFTTTPSGSISMDSITHHTILPYCIVPNVLTLYTPLHFLNFLTILPPSA